MQSDELVIDAPAVRRLVRDQFPELRDRPVTALQTAATANAVFLIGDDLVARLPLQRQDPQHAHAELIREADAAREFCDATATPTPRPVGIGRPGHGYPLPWAVYTWVSGTDATIVDPTGSAGFATDLADLIAEIRTADTRGRTFTGRGRGGHLPDHDAWMETCFRNSAEVLDVPRLRALWDELRCLSEVDRDVMCHGDLTPANVLVSDGRLVGVLDTGGFGPADPALDLVAAWHLLDDEQRTILRRRLDCGDVQWQRGMAWAFQQAMGLVWYYAESNPVMSRWGRRTLDRLPAE